MTDDCQETVFSKQGSEATHMNSQRTRLLAHNLFKLKANKNLSVEREVGAESPPH